ncbi:glycosyltransferase family 2 protein [Algoriphagus namhaensis]
MALVVLYCAFEKGIYEIGQKIPAAQDHVTYKISWQGSPEALAEAPASLQARKDVEIFRFPGRGLSKNRNHLIDRMKDQSPDDFFIIADEDVVFKPNFYSLIKDSAERFAEASLFCFKVYSPEARREFKSYASNPYQVTKWQIDQISSIEVAGRIKVLHHIRFDERLGLGAKFPSGEETAFLADALRAGFKIMFIPEFLVDHPLESSGKMRKDQFELEAIRLIGARSFRIYGEPWATFFYFYSALKNHKKYKDSLSFSTYLATLFRGKKEFKQTVSG